MASGRLPKEVRAVMAGGAMNALLKPNLDVRPIAAGEVLRRLVSKCMCSVHQGAVKEMFAGTQFGVAQKCGTERVVHLARHIFERHSMDPNWVKVKVDLSNAFNLISRAQILAMVHKHLPELYHWVEWCYADDTHLVYGDFILKSREGVQQGDPLGPLLFALVIHTVLSRIKSEVPGLNLNLWYLDDGSLAGRPEDVLRALEILKEEGPRQGIKLNPSKCEIISHPVAQEAAKTLQRRAQSELGITIPDNQLSLDGNYSILGAPVGTPSFCAAFIREQCLAPARASLDAAKKLRDPQVGFALLRRCAGFGQLVHAMRTTPPSPEMAELYSSFDDDMLAAVCSFVGSVEPSHIPQIRRSTRTGGLWFRSASRHMHAAYVASVATCAGLDGWNASDANGFTAALHDVAKVTGKSAESILSMEGKQHRISEAVDQAAFDTEWSQDSVHTRARKVSESGPHASDWLLAIPSYDLNHVFTPREWVALVRWWLGATVYDSEQACPACGNASGTDGYHALTCQCWGGRIYRHHALANEAARALQKAHMNPSREKSFDGSTRPADVYVPHWEAGQPLALDFAVTHPLQQQSFKTTNAEMRTPGSWAATYAHTHKSQFIGPCAKYGVRFQAMVVETYGAWDPAALKALDAIADQYAIHQSVPARYASQILFQRLSVTLMRMNARMLLVRNPSGFADEEPLLMDGCEAPHRLDDDILDDVWEAPSDGADAAEGRF